MILGLTTDRNGSFPRLGVIRKGAPKTSESKPGADLSYFRFVPDVDEAELLASWNAAFGAMPKACSIMLPFPRATDNLSAWREEWVQGGLRHRCDGKTCVLWLKEDGSYSEDPKPCPGGCKQVGRLRVLIMAFERMAYVDVLTTSIWDIISLHECLLALAALRPDIRGVPLTLSRQQRKISTPETDRTGKRTGRRVRRSKWLLRLEVEPAYVRAQLAAWAQNALPTVGAAPQLAAVDTTAHALPAVSVHPQALLNLNELRDYAGRDDLDIDEDDDDDRTAGDDDVQPGEFTAAGHPELEEHPALTIKRRLVAQAAQYGNGAKPDEVTLKKASGALGILIRDDEKRHAVRFFLFEATEAGNLTAGQCATLIAWINAQKAKTEDGSALWLPSAAALADTKQMLDYLNLNVPELSGK